MLADANNSVRSASSASCVAASTRASAFIVGPYVVANSSTKAAGDAYRIRSDTLSCRVHTISSPSSSPSPSAVPQRKGDWPPAGAGACFAVTRNRSPMKPSGHHDASASRPCGRSTRNSSPAAAAWSGTNMTPMAEVTTSYDASSNGRCAASAVTVSTGTSSVAARALTCASNSGTMSVAVTVAQRRAAASAALPEPLATSSTRSPARRSTASTIVSDMNGKSRPICR